MKKSSLRRHDLLRGSAGRELVHRVFLPAMLVPPAAVLYETHCHTPLCGHATGLPSEYAAHALRRGLRGIVVTCHAPLPEERTTGIRMAAADWPRYVAMVAAARTEFAGRLDVRLGLESDYFPGVEPYLRELHAREPLHHVLGSVHYQMSFYRERYFTGDIFAYQQTYYEHLALAAESGLFDTLAHPDLVKNEAPGEWSWARIRPHVERALDRIAAAGTAMELNTSGLLKNLPEMNPSREQLGLMRARGIPVVVGADAHRPGRVADQFEAALDLLAAVGYTEVNVFLDRRRQAIPLATARASLRPC
jgi:histidinol-phosphatase (PHP family)